MNLHDENTTENGAYHAALYLRLSREDENNVSESESIGNQRRFLLEYARQMGFCVYDTYADEGFTGTDFNRPAFRRMLDDISGRKVNMVLTKDLSRLGRDYIDTGHYVERYFPQMGVRYIAVNDGVDTCRTDSFDMTPFKAVVNDAYAKDISRKVITTLRLKARRGEFIGAFPPYGLERDAQNKNKLVPNHETAKVVRMIFEEYMAGQGYTAIAKKLNAMGILSPGMYNVEKYQYKHPAMKSGSWGIDSVRKILMNPIYIGHMVQHKTEVVNYKVHSRRAVHRDRQIVVENACEPLVDRTLFDAVQAMMAKKTNCQKIGSHTVHALSGSLYCGLCGARMTFSKCTKGRRKGEFYALCSRYKRYSGCKRLAVYEKELEDIVREELGRAAGELLDAEELTMDIFKSVENANPCSEVELLQKEIVCLVKRKADIGRIIKNLYEDKVKGIIEDGMFTQYKGEYDREMQELQIKKDEMENRKNRMSEMKNTMVCEKLLSDAVCFRILPKSMVTALVDRIVVTASEPSDLPFEKADLPDGQEVRCTITFCFQRERVVQGMPLRASAQNRSRVGC